MTRVIRGQTLTFTEEGTPRHESRGAIAVGDDGTILWHGPAPLLPHAFRQAEVDEHGEMIVMPGFIDAHIHFPQYRMLASTAPRRLSPSVRCTRPVPMRCSPRPMRGAWRSSPARR
jgi:guanine deaminase